MTTWSVRRGGILDVNPVTRLLRACSRPVDIDGDGVADGPQDPDAADSAARMLLLHVVVERGLLWVAESAQGIVGAAIWLPGDATPFDVGVEDLLRRELRVDHLADAVGPSEHVRGDLEATMAGVLVSLAQEQVEQVLYAVALDPSLPAAELVPLARELVAPGVGAAKDSLAIALDDDRARLLRATGFVELDRIPLGPNNQVWVGSHPGVRVPITA